MRNRLIGHGCRISLSVAFLTSFSTSVWASEADFPPVQRPSSMNTERASAPATEPGAPTSPTTLGPRPTPVAATGTTAAPRGPAAAVPAPPPTEGPSNTGAPAPAPTTEAAAAERRVPAPRGEAVETTSGAGLKKSAETKVDYPHRGFTFDLRIGTQGCFRKTCSAERHDAKPGFRVDGFLGGNVRGWVDIGLSGGWGTFTANVEPGTNAFTLWGVSPAALQNYITQLTGVPIPINLSSLNVEDAALRSARGGPLFRIHFVPKGRFMGYVGSGFGYSLFRAKYKTQGGDLRFDLHGLDVPVEGGFGVFVTKNIALGTQFDFYWAWYGLASIEHPDRAATLPARILTAAAETQGVDLRKQMPYQWSLTFMARARF